VRVAIDVRLVFQTPFNVGSGALADSLAQRPTVKDIRLMPVLPGSSLKGRTRHECERIVRTLTGQPNAVCHGPKAENMCPLDPERMDKPLEERKACPVCQVFGSPWVAGAVRFSDLHWEFCEEYAGPPGTLIRHGVSIGRRRRVAEEGRLFSTETFAPVRDTTFLGRITGDFPAAKDNGDEQVGLLVAGLRAITSMGGGRSRGLGWCRVQARALEIQDGQEIPMGDDWLKEGLARWLNLR